MWWGDFGSHRLRLSNSVPAEALKTYQRWLITWWDSFHHCFITFLDVFPFISFHPKSHHHIKTSMNQWLNFRFVHASSCRWTLSYLKVEEKCAALHFHTVLNFRVSCTRLLGDQQWAALKGAWRNVVYFLLSWARLVRSVPSWTPHDALPSLRAGHQKQGINN